MAIKNINAEKLIISTLANENAPDSFLTIKSGDLKTTVFTINNIDWDTAFGWGNHSGLYSLINHVHTFASLTSKPTTIGEYGILDAYTKSESDAAYATSEHTHSFAQLTSKPTTISGFGITDAFTRDAAHLTFEVLSNKGIANGYAALDSQGKISITNLPNLAITNTTVIASEVNMLLIDAQTGDIAVRTDEDKTYILRGGDPTNILDWELLRTPSGGGNIITTVNGLIGTVQLDLTFSNGLLGITGGNQINLDSKYSLITHSHAFSTITGKPTSLSGYGILGLKTEFNNALTDGNFMFFGDAPTAHTHTFGSLTSKPTTISGYGITDFNSLGDARWLTIQTLAATKSLVAGEFFTSFNKITGLFTSAKAAYSNLTGIPSSFTPSAHEHLFSEITSLPNSLAGYGILDGLTPAIANTLYVDLTTGQSIDGSKIFNNLLKIKQPVNNNINGLLIEDTGTEYIKMYHTGVLKILETSGNNDNFHIGTKDAGDLILKTNNITRLTVDGTTGVLSFVSFPITPSSAPTTDYQVSNKKYVDDAIISGGGGLGVGTKAEFNSALTNGSFIFVGDSPTAHTHPFSEINSRPTTIGGYGITDAFTKVESDAKFEILINKGIANGYAPLDSSGKLPTTHLPALAISDTFVIASEVLMLGLTAETGDVAVRTDENKSYILQGSDPAILSNWQELLTPTDVVQSVNGATGTVILNLAFAAGELSITGGNSVDLDVRYLQIGAKAADSEKLDGVEGSDYVRRTIAQTITATHTYQATQIIQDGNRLDFGSSNDMRIQHDGTTNRIDLYNGNLTIRDSGSTTRFTFSRTTGDFTATGTGVFQGTGSSSFVGNLSVGLTSTSYKFESRETDVTQNAGVGSFKFSATSNYGASKSLFYHRQDVNQVVFNEDAVNLDFRIEGTSDVNLFRTDASANTVGIGGVGTQKLHVFGNILATGTGTFKGLIVNMTDPSGIGLRIKATLMGRAQYTLEDNAGTQIWRAGLTGAGSTTYSFYDQGRDVLKLEKDGNILMQPLGNVAIGGASASEKLHVYGNILATGTVTATDFIGNWNGLNSGQFLRSDIDDETNVGVKTWFEGSIDGQSLSGATVQIDGFMRVGSIFVHEGGIGALSGTALELSNLAGILRWDGSPIITISNSSTNLTQFLRSDVDAIKTNGKLQFLDNKELILGTNNNMRIGFDGTNNYIKLFTTGDLIIKQDNTTRFTFGRTTGNFDLTGGIRFTSNVAFNAGLSGRIYKSSEHGIAIHTTTASVNDFALFTPLGQLKLIIPTGTNNIILNPESGNVGIGEINPTEKFHVSGNFIATGKVTGNGSLITTKAQNDEISFENSHFFGNVSNITNTTGYTTIALATSTVTNYGYSMSAHRRGTGADADMVWKNHHNSIVGVETMRLTREGNLTINGTATATNFILSSDERLKTNIRPVDKSKRLSIDWKNFELKSELGQNRYGVIAQEIEITHPEFVRTNDEGFKSVAYTDLLIAKNIELEDRLEELEAKMELILKSL